MNAVDRIFKRSGPDRCARFASAFTNLEKFAVDTERAAAIVDLFGETREACTPPSATEIAELEAMKMDSSTMFPIEKSISIGPKGQWIKIIGDLPQEKRATIKLTSPDGDPYFKLFDDQHKIVAENDDDPENDGSFDSKISTEVHRGYYLLRVRSLRSNESSAILSIDLK